MPWIAIIVWAGVAAAVCGLALALAVGQALGRRAKPGVDSFVKLVLGPGAWLGGGAAPWSLIAAWGLWTAVGVAVILGVWAAG